MNRARQQLRLKFFPKVPGFVEDVERQVHMNESDFCFFAVVGLAIGVVAVASATVFAESLVLVYILPNSYGPWVSLNLRFGSSPPFLLSKLICIPLCLRCTALRRVISILGYRITL